MKNLVLDAMGVIYSVGDDVRDLLLPYIKEKGGIQDFSKIWDIYHSASLGHMPSSELWKAVGLNPHSVDFSGGIWGNTKKLPAKEIQEVTTMCGHAMVASNLVKSMVDDIKMGSVTASEAGKQLAKQCACGIFNPARAADLMQDMAS